MYKNIHHLINSVLLELHEYCMKNICVKIQNLFFSNKIIVKYKGL